MSKITRQTMQQFGSTSGASQIEQFGSLAAGVPVYTTNVATIQSLAAWLEGWFGAVVGSNLPAIEDLNAICYVFAYQLAYGLQAGIPEWDAGTTYYKGSLCTQSVTGVIYLSLVDNNTNNALSTSNWVIVASSNVVDVTAAGGTTALTASDNGKTIIVDTTSNPQTYTLPAPSLNFRIKIKDKGNAQTNNITINPHASETIDGLSTIVMTFNYGWVELVSDGTNWFLVDQSKNISPWTAYTPTITSFGTPTGVNFTWRRVSDAFEIQGYFTAGTIPAATPGGISLPPGIPSLAAFPSYNGGFLQPTIAGAFQIFPGVAGGGIAFTIQSATQASAPAHTDQFAATGNTISLTASGRVTSWTAF